MKFSHIVIFILSIFLCFKVVLYLNTDLFIASNTVEDRYTTYLTTASLTAIKHTDVDNNLVFNDEDTRSEVVESFFKSLNIDFNADNSNTKFMIEQYVPCLLLIDNDGFYCNYESVYTDSAGSPVNGRVTSPISTWNQEYGIYKVQYYLDDTISILVSDNSTYEVKGTYAEVYAQLIQDFKSGILNEDPSFQLSFLLDKEKYTEEKRRCIIQAVNDQVEYYINKYNNDFRNKKDAFYGYTMPQDDDQNWGRVLVGPTIITFMQGEQIPYYNQYLNIYALSGSEIYEKDTYCITKENGVYYYHLPTCSHVSNKSKKYSSMEDCAKKGAYPCPDCIK